MTYHPINRRSLHLLHVYAHTIRVGQYRPTVEFRGWRDETAAGRLLVYALGMAHPVPGEAAVGSSTLSLLKSIAEISVVFVGLTFVSGWSYLASYYRTFGLNPFELDAPTPVVAALALHILYGSAWRLLLFAVVVAVVVGTTGHLKGSRGSNRWCLVAGLVLLGFFAAYTALVRGRSNANQDMTEESPNLPLVAFSLKSEAAKLDSADQPSCVSYQTFGAMDCKLLLHAKASYYFFRPVPIALAGKTTKLDLFILPESEVQSVHVQRGIDLSESRK